MLTGAAPSAENIATHSGTTGTRILKLVRSSGALIGRVLLVTLKAGGVGLNLHHARHVILLDPWWNAAAERQAESRVHRLGQEEAVTCVRLIATIPEWGGEATTYEAYLKAVQERKERDCKIVLGTGEYRGARVGGGDMGLSEMKQFIQYVAAARQHAAGKRPDAVSCGAAARGGKAAKRQRRVSACV